MKKGRGGGGGRGKVVGGADEIPESCKVQKKKGKAVCCTTIYYARFQCGCVVLQVTSLGPSLDLAPTPAPRLPKKRTELKSG